MQATDHDIPSAYATAQAHLQAGRLAQARRTATEALKTDGPNARLSLVLGQAHAAEDDDDHDDRAEAAYQEGLQAFPDDVELLAAYAELCLRSDYMDRPARFRRGPELAERLRELAPGSAQALWVEQIAAGKTMSGPKPPSPVRTQMHDARLVLTAVGDPAAAAAQARAHAEGRPDDARLATLAETLAALAGPGRAPLRWMVRFPQHTLVIRAALCSLILLAVPAFQWNDWARMAVVVAVAPSTLLQSVLRGARHRAGTRPFVAHAEPGTEHRAEPPAEPPAEPRDVPDFPVLPPVLAPSGRETAVACVVLAGFLAALVGSAVWGYQQYADYPRYTVAAPDRLRGYERLEDTPVQQLTESLMGESLAGDGGRPFAYVYGRKDQNLALVTVFGAVGDFHDMTSDAVESFHGDFESGLIGTGLTTNGTVSADPGRLGGAMRCLSYQALGGGLVNACTWGDKGSVGTVLSADSGRGLETAADLARAVREAVLHEEGGR
ncbi:tetratricopeptide repeat protein [Streptomyces sp. McG7]|uniref:tetratricopeptide repeat protein n=2 Tax=Streptomyces TaxID=1883 RepID=UPI001BEAA053|nr:hypothetical protein [Streptomyces sp. McG7]